MLIKRLLVSILAGIFFPILYAVAVGLLVDHVLPQGYDTTHINGQPLPGPLFAPIAIPIYVDALLGHYGYFGNRSVFDNVWFRSTFFVLFNFLFYTIVTYLVMRRAGWFSGNSIADRNSPDHASDNASA